MFVQKERPPITVVTTPTHVVVHAHPRGSRLTRQQCLDLIAELTAGVEALGDTQ